MRQRTTIGQVHWRTYEVDATGVKCCAGPWFNKPRPAHELRRKWLQEGRADVRVIRTRHVALAPLITISAWTKDRGAINSMTAESNAVCARVWKCSNGWRAHVMALGPDTTSLGRLRATKAEAMKVADECLALLGYVARKAER